MVFNRQLYKQKPSAWGPVGAVQASIFKNADRIGIDPKKIIIAAPMWSKGSVVNYAQNLAYTTDGLWASKKGGLQNTTSGSGYFKFTIPFPTYPFTFIANMEDVTTTPVSSSYDYFVSIQSDTYTYMVHRFLLKQGNSNCFLSSSRTTDVFIEGSGIINGEHAIIGRFNQSIRELIQNGVSQGFETTSVDIYVGTTYFFYIGISLYNLVSAIWKQVLYLSQDLNPSQIAYLSDNPYFLLHRVPPVFYSVPGGAITITTSLDGKVIIRTTTSALLDCMASIKNNAINFLDCAAAVSIMKTDAIDGKTILKSVAASVFDSKASVLSVASLLLDGKAIVSDTGSALLDGKGAVKDYAYDLIDGKGIIKSANTDILDGKLIFLSAGNSVIDGKIIVNAEGFSSALLDGKTIIKSVVTNYLDGLIYIGNAADKTIDGKAIIKSDVCLTIDGKTTIQDVASNLLDGSASILTSIANIVDGKIIISDAAIGLLDGKSVILDDSSIILDGKVFISSGSEINIFDGKITLSVPIVGKVTVSFSMRSPSVSFAIRTPAATVSIN